jgi:hypothetical protein
MKKKIFSLFIIVIAATSCQNSGVEKVSIGIGRIANCCKGLDAAAALVPAAESTNEEVAGFTGKKHRVPLPVYLWDKQMVVW